jgi:acyl-CoA reductase-like NAD-dependent aldehyde dehydrogenase
MSEATASETDRLIPRPVRAGPTDPTPQHEINRLLASLDRRKSDWVRVPIERRATLLRICLEGTLKIAEDWVAQALAAKGLPPDSPLAGEEWISGPMVTIRYLRTLADALDAGGQPDPVNLRLGPDGQQIAQVFPYSTFDRVLYVGMTADLWIEPGKLPTQGKIYRDKRAGHFGPGAVSLILGAGNIAAIPPTDLLHKLFVEDEVVLLKMNPVNEYLGPLLRQAFSPLVDAGFLEFAYGGAEVGSYLCQHEKVESIHLTGSDRTYDAIVWGSTQEEQTSRKAEHRPVVNKRVTAELGAVSPVLVVPGPWTRSEILFQARNVASMVAHNGSFNCNAAKVLVLPSHWKQRDEFMDAVKLAMSKAPARPAYYPGALDRYAAFLDRYPQALALGAGGEGVVPWTLIPDVPARPGEYALNTEAFCGVLAQVQLEASRIGDPAGFLAGATRFVNEHVWGTLSCSILVSNETRNVLGDALERTVGALRYGGVGVNVWPGILFGLGQTSWGAFPGHTPVDIGSGIGAVHNSLLFAHPQQSVAWAPSTMAPKPPWFADHKNLPTVGRKITQFEADPSLVDLPGLGLAALLG